MGRIIKDMVKSTSFPPVKNLTNPIFENRQGFLGGSHWDEEGSWETQAFNWETSGYESDARLSFYASDTNLMRKWEERDINWGSHEFVAQEQEWAEDRGYVYKSQDTRRKFAFDPESLRRS